MGRGGLAGRTIVLGCTGGIDFQKGKSVRFSRILRPLLIWREYDSGKGHTVGDSGMTKMRIMVMKAANVYGKLTVCRYGTKHVTSLCRE